jgi:hypothetical protein
VSRTAELFSINEFLVVMDGEEKRNAVDDDDATRPATPAAAPDRAAAVEVEPSPPAARDVGDTPAASPYAEPAVLRRLAPQEGAGESVALVLDGNLLGRSHICNIPLLSATASRQHAEIVARDGEWFLSPAGGKMVIVEGRPVFDELQLRHEMRIRLGGDELVFLQEDTVVVGAFEEDETYVTRSRRADPTPGPATEPGRSPLVWIALVGAAIVVAALAFWLRL